MVIYSYEFKGTKLAKLLSTGVITEYPIPTDGSSPYGITTGPDGNLWFTEAQGNKVASISPKTGGIKEYPIPTENSAPVYIYSGPDGTCGL